MSIYSQIPVYNLKAVYKDTGLKPDVLRAWERRYGLPLPQRTAGGHRLYSRYDIELIKWLLARQEEGMRISQAVDLWKEQTKSGADLLAPATGEVFSSPSAAPLDSNLDGLRQSWLRACYAYDERAADQVLNQAFALYSVEAVCTNVLQSGLHAVGEAWFDGKATVQQEHFASSLAMRRLEVLIEGSPLPNRSETILVSCPAGEWHTFSPLLITLLLRRAGWNVVYLGANVPLTQFSQAVDAVHPNLVILIAQQLTTVVGLKQMTIVLRSMPVMTAFGGQIFNRVQPLREKVPGHFLGESIQSAMAVIERLLTNPSAAPLSKNQTLESGDFPPVLAARYREERRQIELALYDRLKSQVKLFDAVDTATAYFGDEMAAALALDNLDYLVPDIEWIRLLLKNNHLPPATLTQFLTIYAQAVEQVLGDEGKPITMWLGRLIADSQ